METDTDIDENGKPWTMVRSMQRVYKVADKMPSFNGDVNKYLAEHLFYPKRSGKPQTLMMQFFVDENGHVEMPHPLEPGGDADLVGAAIRAISKMPNWVPGENKGEPVAVFVTLPVTFSWD